MIDRVQVHQLEFRDYLYVGEKYQWTSDK